MPAFTDDVFLGNAPPVGASYKNWTVPDGAGSANPGANSRGFGPMGRVYVYNIVPAALATNNICLAQIVTGASNALLNGALAAGGVATIDVPRSLQMVSSGAGDTTQTVTVTGTDFYGQPQTERRTLNGTTIVNFLKAFSTVTQVALSATTAGNFSMGTTDVFGLPAAITDAGFIGAVRWNNTLALDAGTLVLADGTNPATNATGDVRGTYKPSANASNGARRLVVALALTGIQVGPNATQLGLYGVVPA